MIEFLRTHKQIYNIIIYSILFLLELVAFLLINNIIKLIILAFLIADIFLIIKNIRIIIKEKSQQSRKFKIICYSILTLLFGIIFVEQFAENSVYMFNRYIECNKYTQVTTGIIDEVSNETIIIKTIMNEKETEIKLKSNGDKTKKNNKINIYYNKNDVNDYVLSNPNVSLLIYLIIYFLLTVTLFVLFFINAKVLYYEIRPKKEILNNIKIKQK